MRAPEPCPDVDEDDDEEFVGIVCSPVSSTITSSRRSSIVTDCSSTSKIGAVVDDCRRYTFVCIGRLRKCFRRMIMTADRITVSNMAASRRVMTKNDNLAEIIIA